MHALVIGAGPVGRSTAEYLASHGHEVAVMTRSGTSVGQLRSLTGDASKREDLRSALKVFPASHIICCLHAPYTARQWRESLIPAEDVILSEAEQYGLHVTFPESVYAFGTEERVVDAMSRPIANTGKPGIRTALLNRRDRSTAATCSVVASDYYGPGCTSSSVVKALILDRLSVGKRPLALFSRHTPHAFTFLPDFARALAESAIQSSTGIAVTPTDSPLSQEAFIRLATNMTQTPFRRPIVLNTVMLRTAGLFNQNVGGVAEMEALWTTPQRLQSTFDWPHTPLNVGLRRSLPERLCGTKS
ncbi:NAD-dependent epimerase/dehydratase family protein [Corynebacterium falsenii]|uniref:NAD-dependent epimerase/dehydratase family protein n=1 Tax=Corynebacterium falsenii TaxID=108486 RepID=UPI003FCEF80F